MDNGSTSRDKQSFQRFGAALAIGVSAVTVFNILFSLLTDSSLNVRDEMAVFILQIVMVSSPFVLLAVLGIGNRKSWLVGILLTTAFWGYYFLDAFLKRGDGTGVNIGLALLMLASPLIIAIASVFAARIGKSPGS